MRPMGSPMVYLIVAPAGSGKTTHAISRVRRLRASAPLAPVWVVPPNFPQVACFHRRRPANCRRIFPLRSHRPHEAMLVLTG